MTVCLISIMFVPTAKFTKKHEQPDQCNLKIYLCWICSSVRALKFNTGKFAVSINLFLFTRIYIIKSCC